MLNLVFLSSRRAAAAHALALVLALAGMIRSRTPRLLKLQTMTGPVALPAGEIEKVESSETSLMPAGLIGGIRKRRPATSSPI